MKIVATGGFVENTQQNMLIGKITPNCQIMPINQPLLEAWNETSNLMKKQIDSSLGLSPMLIDTLINTKFSLNIPIVEHIDLIKKIEEIHKSLNGHERVRSIVGVRKFRSKK